MSWGTGGSVITPAQLFETPCRVWGGGGHRGVGETKYANGEGLGRRKGEAWACQHILE